MAYIKGEIRRDGLIDEIKKLLTKSPDGISDPYWKTVQSGTYANEGYIFASKGSKGTEQVYIRIREYNTTALAISLITKYTPNSVIGLDGVAENELGTAYLYFSIDSYPATAPIEYILNFDKDRIMIYVTGHPNAANKRKSFVWVGLPLALDSSDDSNRAVIAASRESYTMFEGITSGYSYTYYSQAAALRTRSLSFKQRVSMIHQNVVRSKGWGGSVHLPDIYLDYGSAEGIRSIMHGVYPIFNESDDFRDGDEVTVGNKRFTILLVNELQNTTYHHNGFPSHWLAIEQLN